MTWSLRAEWNIRNTTVLSVVNSNDFRLLIGAVGKLPRGNSKKRKISDITENSKENKFLLILKVFLRKEFVYHIADTSKLSLVSRNLHNTRRSDERDNKPAKVTHFLLCPQLDYLPWILFAEAVSKAMVVFDITIPCLEFIQRCLEHFYCTFFWHRFFFSPFEVKQKKEWSKCLY